MHALQAALRLLLALVLGLGPVGAAVLAASLHAPWCRCCGTDESAPGCCEPVEAAGEEPALVATEPGCPCALVLPERESEPAMGPRVCEARLSARAELERGQRAVELAWSDAPLAWDRDEGPPGEAREAGPPGSRRAHGGARAAALGALLL